MAVTSRSLRAAQPQTKNSLQGRALGILWDAADAELPIYRTDPADNDVENTLASAEAFEQLARETAANVDGFLGQLDGEPLCKGLPGS
jgi:hypothetical protein